MNLMLVRKRTKINRKFEKKFKVETEQREDTINRIKTEALKKSVEKDKDQELPGQTKAEDEELFNPLISAYGL